MKGIRIMDEIGVIIGLGIGSLTGIIIMCFIRMKYG